MVHFGCSYALFKGTVEADGLLITKYGNISVRDFNRFIFNSEPVLIVASDFVKKELNNFEIGDSFEVLCKLNWKEHHCIYRNKVIRLYRIRKSCKCIGGLHNFMFKFGVGRFNTEE